MTEEPLNLGIIGAGIGGLALAILIRKIGFNVTVFERLQNVSEFGSGVQLSPNGVKVLRKLGVEEELIKFATNPERILIRSAENDKFISQIKLGSFALSRYSAGFYQIHRSDLINILYQKAKELGVKIYFGADATVKSTTSKLSVVSAGGEFFKFDVVVGADGVHSSTREKFFQYVKPTFLRQVAYRVTLPLNKVEDYWQKPEVKIHVGPGAHIVSYPLYSRSLVNVVLCCDQETWTSDGWSNIVDTRELLVRFKYFKIIQIICNHIESVHKWGLLGYENQSNWYFQSLALLGDSCHPMLPYLAQGANQALEDADSLSYFLSRKLVFNVSEALHRYDLDRTTRVKKVQTASFRNAKFYHLSNYPARLLLYTALNLSSRVTPNFLLSQFDWLYSYELPS